MTSFAAGQEMSVGGMKFRCVAGRKRCIPCKDAGIPAPCGHDLMLEWFDSSGSWRAVPMPALYLGADFLVQNEDRLYPPSMGFQGGQMFVDAMHHAIARGRQEANEELARQRIEHRRKEAS